MGTTPAWSHTNTFPGQPVSASKARAFVGAVLVEHRLWHLVHPVRVVASELATNAMLHGAAPFTLTLSVRVDDVVLSVRRAQPRVPTQREPSTVELVGPGLAIVEVLSREWGAATDEDGGTVLWAAFPAQPRPGH
jgi:hypothetical protein